MLIEKVFLEAEAVLKEHKIADVIIGLTVAAVVLDNGEVGTSLILIEEMHNRGEAKFKPKEIIGMNAIEMARWALEPKEHILKRTLGMAAINACSYAQDLSGAESMDAAAFAELRQTDTVGVIGWMRHLVTAVEARVNKVIVYDNGEQDNVYAPKTQDELLPHCEVVFITGTTFVNMTIDHLLDVCKNARELILVGPTTPMFPKAYKNTNIKVLAGGVWNKEHKDDIFELIKINGGIPSLSPFLEKKSLRIT